MNWPMVENLSANTMVAFDGPWKKIRATGGMGWDYLISIKQDFMAMNRPYIA
jgi:hypothetical protein